MSSLSQRIADLLVRWRYVLLAIAIVTAAIAWFPSRQLDFDRSIENMFAPDDPLLPPYKKLKSTFGGNEIVMAVYRDEELLNASGVGIKRLQTISAQLKDVDGVRAVLSLAEVSRAVEGVESFGGEERTRPAIVDPKSKLGVLYRKLFQGYTHGEDGVTAAVVCMLVPESEPDVAPRRATIDEIRRIMEEELPDGLAPGVITGEPAMVVDGFRYVEEDGDRLGWATTILLAVTIILCFRSLRWVLIPLAVVQFTLLLTKATLVWTNLDLSMVSSMLTAIVTVVGIATVVHVIVRFRDARASGTSSREALTSAVAILVVPVFWACCTDAVGFASLLVAKVGPVQDFGVMMAIGSLYVLVGAVLLVPGLALMGRFDADPRRPAWGEGVLDLGLARLVQSVKHHPRIIGAGSILFVLFASAGLFQLEVETDFTKNFRQNSPIVHAYQVVETDLGGAGVWDVVLPAPQTVDDEYLDRVRRLEERLRAIEVQQEGGGDPIRLTKVISLADAERDADLAIEVPAFLKGLNTPDRRLRLMALQLPDFSAALRSTTPDDDGHYYMRIMLRAPERQSARSKLQLIDEVQRVVEEELDQDDWRAFLKQLPKAKVKRPAPSKLQPSDKVQRADEEEPSKNDTLAFHEQSSKAGADPPRGEVTGFFVLLTNLIKSMVADQWICFGVATLGIGLMMLLAFRSPVLAGIALVPNIMPILMVLGMMGWLAAVGFDVKINMGAAMIAAVSMGLSIDSSIHYITSFQRARKSGKDVSEALDEVQQTVGRAVVFSTIALIVGFTVLCSSNFVPTIYFGVLVSLSMLGGLFGNLVVLPLLLKLVTKPNNNSPSLGDEGSEGGQVVQD